MRTVKWNAFLPGLCGFAVALGVMVASARADVTSERGASILIFPKVMVAGSLDTTIQITNISNDLVFARCFYVNAQLRYEGVPEHPVLNPPLCMETDFEIRLTRQQPTHWLVSRGRGVDPFDYCESGSTPTCAELPASSGVYRDINNFGIDPGAVPPVPEDFIGELKCVEVDASGNPIGGNHLKGHAIIVNDSGDISSYSAIGIEGTDLAGATGLDLRLDNPDGETSGQYNACPAVLHLNHFSEDTGASDLGEDDSDVNTELTVVPCSEDLENQIPKRVTLQFKIYNEFEVPFSTSTSVSCWKNIWLGDIGNTNVFDEEVLGSLVAYSKITPADSNDGGVVAVAEETWNDASDSARAAFNVHTTGDRFFGPEGTDPDHIVLPGQQ